MTITLRDLLSSLGSATAELVVAPSGDNVPVSSVVLVDEADLADEAEPASSAPDLYVQVGVQDAEAVRWLQRVARRAPGLRPVAVLTKTARSPMLRAAARDALIALVAVNPKVRWDAVFPMIQRILRRADAALDPDLMATDTDLFELAQIVAANAGGLVSIEDARSRVLAYSASDETADELRTLSILGREGPPDYLRALEQWGVFDRLRRTDEVIDVPAHPQLGTRHRLVVSIRDPAVDKPATARYLGSIWVQEGDHPLAADAPDVLRGAAAVAARTISRSLDAPSTEALLIQRLFGARGGGVDVPSLTSALNLPVAGPAAVIGLAAGAARGSADITGLGAVLRLQASAFRADSLSTIIGRRAYVLLPGYRSVDVVVNWTRSLVERVEARHGVVLRAAIATPVPDLGRVAGARVEVDRVLDVTASAMTQPARDRVTTLAESLTAVLLGEILDVIGRHAELTDPRLQALRRYDQEHGASLRDSVEAYLSRHGDVRTAAGALHVHPNTLRYRLRRAEEILGIDLGDASDRLLLQLQLAAHRRGSG